MIPREQPQPPSGHPVIPKTAPEDNSTSSPVAAGSGSAETRHASVAAAPKGGTPNSRLIEDREVRPTLSPLLLGKKKSGLRYHLIKPFRATYLFVLHKARSTFNSFPTIVRITDRAIAKSEGISPMQANQLMLWAEQAADPQERQGRITLAERIITCINGGHKELHACDANVTSLPVDCLSKMTWLKVLNLSNNKLQELPAGLRHLRNLRVLNVSGNELRGMPDIFEKMSHLDSLNLACNAFTSVPDVCASLQSRSTPDCSIDMRGNSIEAYQVRQWCQVKRAHNLKIKCTNRVDGKNQMSKMPLGQKMAHWFELAGKPMPPDFPDRFPEELVQNGLNDYMVKLVGIYEYTRSVAGSRTMARMLVSLLEQMAGSKEIRDACAATLVVLNASCEDGALIGLNDMFIAIETAKIGNTRNLDAMIALKKGLMRKEMVENYAAAKYQEIERRGVRGPFPPDEIEVRMTFLLRLQKDFDLPLPPNQRMMFEWYSQVTDDDVRAARISVQRSISQMTNKQIAKELVEWPAFREKMEKDYIGHILEVGDKYAAELKSATTGWQPEVMKAIQERQQNEVTQLLQDIAEEYLDGNPREHFTQSQYLAKHADDPDDDDLV